MRSIFTLQRAAISTVRLKCVGQFTKYLGHFHRALEVELVGGELHAMGIAHGLAGLDAQQDFLGVSVVVVEIVAIVGGDQRNARFLGQAHEVAVDALFDFEALVLNFEKEISFSKNIAEAVGVFARLVKFLFDDGFGDRAAEARGESD